MDRGTNNNDTANIHNILVSCVYKGYTDPARLSLFTLNTEHKQPNPTDDCKGFDVIRISSIYGYLERYPRYVISSYYTGCMFCSRTERCGYISYAGHLIRISFSKGAFYFQKVQNIKLFLMYSFYNLIKNENALYFNSSIGYSVKIIML